MHPAAILPLALVSISLAQQPAPQHPAPTAPISLQLDCTDAPRRIFHSTLNIPCSPGPLTLVYPNWIPGEHAPIGPIADIAGFSISANHKPLPWRRDPTDMLAVRCDVPAGVSSITVTLDYLSPTSDGTFTDGPASTSQLAIIDWHLMLVYPYDTTRPAPTDSLTYTASLKLPKGWRCGGALARAGESPDAISFAPTSLTMLVDHPVLIGAHYRDLNLTPGSTPEHHIDVVADSDAALAIPDARLSHYTSLIAETATLFGARRYQNYHFLLSLSDHTTHFGLEHHECSDDRQAETFLTDDDTHRSDAALLSHEYVHSWNGKFRRPAGMATPDFQQPMKDHLIWVYEGLTEYYGDILAVRCGNWTPDEYRDYLARTAATLDHTPGRTWRNLQDTCDAAPFLYIAKGTTWTRGTDFYDEGELLWLEADTLIRTQTHGAKSLDDFCRAFHGEGFQNGTLAGEPPRVVPYTFDDVIAALNAIAPYAWADFFRSRLDALTTEAPKGGITAGGYTLTYSDAPNLFIKDAGDFTFSLGLRLKDTGEVDAVTRHEPADAAGLSPGMKVVAVNGRKYSADLLRQAIRASQSSPAPIELLVENTDFYSTLKVDYHDGDRTPHLTREMTRPDLLSDILKPLAPAQP